MSYFKVKIYNISVIEYHHGIFCVEAFCIMFFINLFLSLQPHTCTCTVHVLYECWKDIPTDTVQDTQHPLSLDDCIPLGNVRSKPTLQEPRD